MWGRIPWGAATSFVWTCILSAMRGGDVVHGEDMAGGAVNRATMQVMEEGVSELFTCPIELDPSQAHLCVNASGPDQLGWVAKVAQAVATNGGNVTHSKMVRMGQDFTILMHVSTPPENLRVIVAALNNNEELKPLNLRTSSLSRRETIKQYNELALTVHCVGEDKPGMLSRVAQHLHERLISVENLSTELRLNSEGTRREFVINAECVGKEAMDEEDLKHLLHELSELKQDVGLDVLDIRVHR
jgi:glycine cleavage system regulatory protein